MTKQGNLEDTEQEASLALRAPAQLGDLEPQLSALMLWGGEIKAQTCCGGFSGRPSAYEAGMLRGPPSVGGRTRGFQLHPQCPGNAGKPASVSNMPTTE